MKAPLLNPEPHARTPFMNVLKEPFKEASAQEAYVKAFTIVGLGYGRCYLRAAGIGRDPTGTKLWGLGFRA